MYRKFHKFTNIHEMMCLQLVPSLQYSIHLPLLTGSTFENGLIKSFKKYIQTHKGQFDLGPYNITL